MTKHKLESGVSLKTAAFVQMEANGGTEKPGGECRRLTLKSTTQPSVPLPPMAVRR